MATIIETEKSYCEIGQSISMKYAFLAEEGNDVWRMQHGWIKCRDFFNDFLIATWKGEDYPRIYSFNPNGKSDPMDLRNVRMAIQGGNFDAMNQSLSLLNDFEKRCSIGVTTLEKFEGSDHYFLTGSNNWQANTMVLSLYTHIIRVLYGHGDAKKFKTLEGLLQWVVDNTGGNEYTYTKALVAAFDLQELMTNAVDIQAKCEHPVIRNEPRDTSIMHDSGGIWSASVLYLDNGEGNRKNSEIMHGAFLEEYRLLVGG